MQLVQRTLTPEGTALEHPLTVEFVWLDKAYVRHGDLFYLNMLGVFLFNRWQEAETLRRAWISYKDVLERSLYDAIYKAGGKIFPKFTYNISLDKLTFEHGRVWNAYSGYSLYCSSRADLEERLELANTDGREILAFKADGGSHTNTDDVKKNLKQVGDEIGYPFDEHLKQHPQKLLDFTRNRVRRTYVSYGENGAREGIAYPELLGRKISVRYVDAQIPNFVQVKKEGEGVVILLDYELTRQSLKVVRGAVCVGLSEIVIGGQPNGERIPIGLLQIDAFARGFSREVMAYASYAESSNRLINGLTPDQITAIVRQSESILADNLHEPLYSNNDGFIPLKID